MKYEILKYDSDLAIYPNISESVPLLYEIQLLETNP